MAGLITTPCASEGGHFYDSLTQKPVYTIIGRHGKERNTTVADMKRLRADNVFLVPGVSSITSQANAYGLNNWNEDQVLLATLTLPRIDGESEKTWIKRIKADAKETARKARERGTQIHAWIQAAFEGRWDDVTPLGVEYYDVVQAALKAEYLGSVDWRIEHPFATDRFGGKVDLHSQSWGKVGKPYCGFVLDIKTTDKPLADMKLYDSHFMQLGAYRRGLCLPNAQCGIIFVSTLDKAAKVMQCEEKDLKRGEGMFEALTTFWYARTGLEASHDR
jgi:hypothetical protein